MKGLKLVLGGALLSSLGMSGCGLNDTIPEYVGVECGEPCGPCQLGVYDCATSSCSFEVEGVSAEAKCGGEGAQVLFVDGAMAGGAQGDGSQGAPLSSLEAALARRPALILAAGAASMQLGAPVRQPVIVLGGFDRVGARYLINPEQRPLIEGFVDADGDAFGMLVESGGGAMTLERVRVQAPPARRHSYGILAVGTALKLVDVEVFASAGAPGVDGQAGAAGQAGGAGERGGVGRASLPGEPGRNAACSIGTEGGKGGRGGTKGPQGTEPGREGERASAGARGGDVEADGSPGEDGAGGEDGAASGQSAVVGTRWAWGAAARAGTSGRAGGGGGGGGGASVRASVSAGGGGGGGGGGAGGCPGTGGSPGTSGGSSFGVMAITSSLSLLNSRVVSSAPGRAGRGGPGGAGGGGGAGGAGYTAPDAQASSGQGGAGGAGGTGGSGGAGEAGVSVSVYCQQASLAQDAASQLIFEMGQSAQSAATRGCGQ